MTETMRVDFTCVVVEVNEVKLNVENWKKLVDFKE